MRTQDFERKIDVLNRDNDEKLAFVGCVKRIEEQANFRCLCDFDEHAPHTAARPITQNMDDRS
jgi:hypothetical protein